MKHFLSAITLLLATFSFAMADDQSVLDTATTLATVLKERPQERTRLWIEWDLKDEPAVAQRFAALREDFHRAQHNNSFCLGARGIIGKDASVCSERQFTLMILSRQPGETISDNLAYFQEFVGHPLQASLRQYIRALVDNPIDYGSDECVRLVIRDPKSQQLDPHAPVLILIRPEDPASSAS